MAIWPAKLALYWVILRSRFPPTWVVTLDTSPREDSAALQVRGNDGFGAEALAGVTLRGGAAASPPSTFS